MKINLTIDEVDIEVKFSWSFPIFGDEGIGSYEYGGQPGFHSDIRLQSFEIDELEYRLSEENEFLPAVGKLEEKITKEIHDDLEVYEKIEDYLRSEGRL